MAVIKVGNIIPKHTRISVNNANSKCNQLTNLSVSKSINSCELQFGFIPIKKSNDLSKVERFIDSLV